MRSARLLAASFSLTACLAALAGGACSKSAAVAHGSGAADAGSDGSEGGGDAGSDAAPLDPLHCAFEVPPTHPTATSIPQSAVMVGLGSAVLPMPIGTPLGGYGDRCQPLPGSVQPADKRPLRYARAFNPSIGLADTPLAEAIAIQAGQDTVVVVRVDTVLLNENNLFALETAIAPDGSMRGHVILSASHSHSSWAAWQASLVLMPGIDMPREELATRAIGAMADAAKQALGSLAPAKIGFAVNDAFDPMDTLTHDRRYGSFSVTAPDGETGVSKKDPYVWAMRVDDMTGKPIAAIVNLPIHGIVGDENNELVTTDAPGFVERAISSSLGIPVIHLQGAAGNINPSVSDGRVACPDLTRCLDLPRLEVIGARAATLVAPLVQGITTSGQVAMEVVTQTFPVRRNSTVPRPATPPLYYTPFDPTHVADGVLFNDAGWAANPIDGFNTVVGAGLCGSPTGGSLAPIPGSTMGPYNSCLDLQMGAGIVFGLFFVDPPPLPLCDTIRATASAVRFTGLTSGDWLWVSTPGEPTAPYAAYLRASSPAGKDHTLIVGYSDDHAGYLLTTEDWLNGGYEPSINVWGPLEGEMILEGVIAAAKVAWTPEREDPEVGSSRYTGWTFPTALKVTQFTTTDHGTPEPAPTNAWWPDTSGPVVLASAAPVPRAVGAARFAWHGGDPAVDLPEVLIEQQASGGTFVPLVDAHGRQASSRWGHAPIAYVPEPLTSNEPTSHLYSVTWQPVPPDPYSETAPGAPYALPLGAYRFHIKGAALAASGQVTYDFTSAPFTVVAAPLAAASTAVANATGIAVQALLGSAPGLRALRASSSDKGVPLPGPWTVTVNFNGATAQTATVTPDAMGNGTVPLTAAQLAMVVSVDVRDPAGNGGLLTLP
jgi:neutral ceramidase